MLWFEYEVLKRQKASEVLDNEKLIFFERNEKVGSGFKVRFLVEYLKEMHLLFYKRKIAGKHLDCVLGREEIRWK